LSSTACSHFLKLPFHSTKSFPSQRTVLLASIFCSSFLLPDSSFHGFTFVLASFRNGLVERTGPPRRRSLRPSWLVDLLPDPCRGSGLSAWPLEQPILCPSRLRRHRHFNVSASAPASSTSATCFHHQWCFRTTNSPASKIIFRSGCVFFTRESKVFG
jgi:hypothetical protein